MFRCCILCYFSSNKRPSFEWSPGPLSKMWNTSTRKCSPQEAFWQAKIYNRSQLRKNLIIIILIKNFHSMEKQDQILKNKFITIETWPSCLISYFNKTLHIYLWFFNFESFLRSSSWYIFFQTHVKKIKRTNFLYLHLINKAFIVHFFYKCEHKDYVVGLGG